MARRKGRVKDKWREKRWITVNAPDSFNNVPIGYVPITDDENASGRVLVSIMENFQTKDGHIKIPQVLQSYMGNQKEI